MHQDLSPDRPSELGMPGVCLLRPVNVSPLDTQVATWCRERRSPTRPTLGAGRRSALSRSLVLVALLAFTNGTRAADTETYRDFLAENAAAMDRMMAAMHVRPSGDVDEDFVAMMIPHHQGAIDMARAQLLHGRDQRLRRIAQEIIVTQQQEIEVMRLAVRDRPPTAMAPTMLQDAARPASAHATHGGR